jgi:hypothetical protein
MNRTDPTFREHLLSEEETDAFLDELFTNLFDSDDLSADSDKIPDLSILDR